MDAANVVPPSLGVSMGINLFIMPVHQHFTCFRVGTTLTVSSIYRFLPFHLSYPPTYSKMHL
jgi:hypothetical protein